MQTSYLRYMVEIERTRSITQAASNLYLTQPSLSRILHETEKQLGYAIFERTNRGVRPTPAGVAFLEHARRILSELDALRALGRDKRPAERFRVCMPRSAGILALAADYLNALPPDRPLDAMLRECHVRQAFDILLAGEADLAIIRFRAEYRDYFQDHAAATRLGFEPLNRYRYQVVMGRDNPLAKKEQVTIADLEPLTEITHGDTFRADRRSQDAFVRRIYSVDRHAQLTLLARIPNAYMWLTATPPRSLAPWGLVQREVEDNRIEYQNALLFIDPDKLNEIELGFMDRVRAEIRQ